MESRNGGASSEGFLIPVSESSDVFQSNILALLQSAYLYEESKQFFRYKSAVLVKNPDLEDKYEAFRARKTNAGYSEDDLKETYGFLLFDNDSKANTLGQTGIICGNSTCTTLGDPAKGVYISMYSDCLDLNRWYHGKSGYIAIIRLTKGKVKKVTENYTQNFTEPTVGFDCHVSDQLPSVSAKTSSFLAFERTQFYIYELLHDGNSETSKSPSAACPFAFVSFSYMDTKASLVPLEKSEVQKQVHHYLPWRGQLQIESQIYHIDLRSAAVTVIPVQLPSLIKVNQAIRISVLRNLLPRAVFETSYTEEVFFEGFYCDLYEFVSSEANEASSFALLLSEIKEKDLALSVPLIDGGFLILMHSSQFLRYDDADSASAEVMQGLFVFPDSRLVRRDTKFREKNYALSSEILRVLPVLSYAEGEAEKTSMEPKDELCEVLTQHMQSYATLINPGFSSSPSRPSRELSMFPDQYDVAEAHKHLYSSPEWNNVTWETFKSYLSKPTSFQLPLAKVSEILASGQEEQREELDDDVYICLSSPEEAPTSPVCMEAGDQLPDEQSLGNIETSMDIGLPSAQLQIGAIPVSQSIVTDNLQSESVTKGDRKCPHLTEEPNKTDDPGAQDPLTPPTSEDLPAELIVSITSAEQNVPDEVSTAKHTDFHLSGLSTMAKLQTAEVNSVIDKSDKAKTCLAFSKVTKRQKSTKRRKRRRIYSSVKKKVSRTSVKTQSLKTAVSSVEVEDLNCKTQEHSEELNLPQLRNSLKPKWKKLHRRKCRFGELSPKNKKLRSAAVNSAKTEKNIPDVGLTSLESPMFLGLEALPLRKKMERWDLKPVISECGRILLPFGSVDFADQVKSMQCTKKDESPEKVSHDVPVTLPDTVTVDKQIGTTSETAVAETTSTNDENSQLDPGDNILTLPIDQVPLTPNFCTASPRNDETNSFSSKTIETKQLESFSPVKLSPKGELLLSKLKSVLSRRKKNLDLPIKPQKREHADPESESCFKKRKVDSDTETPKGNNATPQSVSVSKMASVDPLFAYCLGLTPKENIENVQNPKKMDTLPKKDSTEKEEHASLDKQQQILQRPLSIFPRRSRIKTLKRHQGVSAENVKKKWWLHFQTPACFTSEKNYNDCTSDKTIRKTVKEKMKSTCTSTDALNLLADLALSNDKDSPQPNQPLESAKKCDLSKSLSSADQESVLHALLRNPAARALQSLESPSKCSFVAHNNLVALISKDHAYSLPPSSLLLDLSGTTFQVPPLSGSTRLLNHHQTMYGDGAKALHPSVSMGDINEHSKTSDYLQKHRRKLKHSRTFVIKEKSIQITRKWEENYNFNLDSRFTSDAKDKVIIRALHGPWDFSMQDTTEEVRLIFHMWIGLFYSRSTSRFFQVDPTLMQACSEESGSVASDILSGRTRPEHEISSAVALSSPTETLDPVVSKLLDLSKKEKTVSEPESGILDLSVKNFNVKPVPAAQQLNKKVTSVSSEPLKTLSALKPAADLQEKETFQFHKEIVHFRDISTEVKDDKIKSKTTETEHKLHFDHNETPSTKGDRILCQSEEMRNVSLKPETDGATFRTEPVLHGCSKDISFKKVGIENEKATVKSLPQEDALCSSTFVMDKEVNDVEERNGMHTGVLDDRELSTKESCQMGSNPCQDDNRGPSLDTMNRNDESDIVCNGNVVNEKLLSEESLASLNKTDNQEGNMDCCPRPTTEEFKSEDVCVKKDGDENKSCISAADVDRDLRNQSLPKLCDGPVQQGYISENSQVDEQLPLSDSTEDVLLCVNPNVLKHESPTFNTPSDIAPKLKDTPQENLDMNKTDCQNVVLPISDEGSNSFNDAPAVPCIPQEKDSVESPNKKEASYLSFYTCNDPKSLEFNSACEEENLEQTLLEPQKSPSKCEVKNVCEVDEQFTEKNDPKTNETSIRLSKSLNLVLNPFKDVVGVYVVPPQDKVEKVVQDQKPVSFICEVTKPVAVLPDQICITSKISSKKEALSPCKISLLDETYTPKVFRKEFDSRSPTPTIDEKPHDSNLCLSPSRSTGVLTDSENCQNSTPTDELSFNQKLQTSTGNTDPNSSGGLGSDVKIRTLRVLQSLNKFLEIPNNHETPGDTDFHSYKSFVSVEVLQEEQKTSPSNLSNESRLYSQRPVMAVKPSKSEESQAHWLSKDIDPKTTSQCKQSSGHLVKYLSPNSMFIKENSDGLDSNHSVGEHSSKTTCLADTTYSKSDTEEDKFALLNPPCKNKRRTMSKLSQIPSLTPSSVQCSKSEESCHELGGGHSKFMEYTVNGTAEDITKHVNQRDTPDKSLTCEKQDTSSEDDHIAGPQSSLRCTVFNTGQKRPYSFLEQISQRCLQNDLTQASMEQECLIFSEQMKNLLKKSKKEPIHQLDTYDSSTSCPSPLTISFSSLEEQEDSMEFLDTPIVRQKIQVDMSNSKDWTAFTEEGKVLHSPSRENNNPMEHAGVSAMTSECARLYNARMNDVCSAKKVTPRSKRKKGHQSDLRTDKSNHFDFCDQMKKELDETFRSNLNAVVKKSCKTKYRFFIMVTSEEVFFKETKAQLEAEGHTAVQPSEFFLGEDSSSSLLVILRNEDIAEHICKIPHLLKLKMSPGVLFAGIDEPDDVINLTHQELFTRAGFVMFDRALLEPLSFCNMNKISKILQELSRMGKWKWMLHYRDSRRLKENARLSEEANKKKLLMYWCQDAGILEVLPYHECDQMTKDQPDYLACLLRLQVQHISSRFPVFITDAATDGAFERNGILTMTLNTFLTKSSTETFSLTEKR